MTERELFVSALEIEDATSRRQHILAHCAGDNRLLKRVTTLLASHDQDREFLQTPVMQQLGKGGPAELAATVQMESGSTVDKAPPVNETVDIGVSTSDWDDLLPKTPQEFLSATNRPDSLGRLSHYEVLEVLGCGAFGTVFRAFDEKLHRVVAIKVLTPELALTTLARERFLREARAAAAIRHENVVAIYGVEEVPLPYLVMEYIPGESLQQRLDKQGALPLPDVLQLGTQIAEALVAAHAKGLIHRDIKPGNMLLEAGPRERIKITDFGLACAADDTNLAYNGMIAGTPMYMAPEQATGHKLDQRADLFSFGSVLYQMLTGSPPFIGNTSVTVLRRVAKSRPQPILELKPDAPDWLCEIITKLHAKQPDERFQTAAEVAALLAESQVRLQHRELPNPDYS